MPESMPELPPCFCGAVSTKSIREYKAKWGVVTLIQCSQCRAWRSSLFPDEQDLATLYTENSIYKRPTDREFLQQRDGFRHIVDDLRSLPVSPGSLVEVGCNSGYTLSLMQENGWSVTGIESNRECAEYARKILSVPIHAELKDLAANTRFDVALMSHVLEHVSNPNQLLQDIRSRLNKKGIIYVKVPNYGSWTVRHVIRGKWASFLPLQHLWYFDSRSLCQLLKSAGFLPERIYTRDRFSLHGKNLLYSAARTPFACWSRLAGFDGGELVGMFSQDSSITNAVRANIRPPKRVSTVAREMAALYTDVLEQRAGRPQSRTEPAV